MTCQGISLGLVSIGCCFFLSVTRRGLLFVLHTECLGGHGVSLSRIFEFSNFFFTRNVADVTDFLCPEFANFRIVSSHGMSRNNLFITNYRISFTRNVAEVTEFFVPIFFLVPNFRIIELFLHTECRGWLWGLLFM